MIDYVDVDGFGRNFIARRLLDATSMKEALQVVIRPDAFVGHNYQIMSLDKREAYQMRMLAYKKFHVPLPLEAPKKLYLLYVDRKTADRGIKNQDEILEILSSYPGVCILY